MRLTMLPWNHAPSLFFSPFSSDFFPSIYHIKLSQISAFYLRESLSKNLTKILGKKRKIIILERQRGFNTFFLDFQLTFKLFFKNPNYSSTILCSFLLILVL
ncbi:uncharacterized protein DS421_13g409030 [Arachis hypogaea]|nr:uncharacterized protein DS421_13g409030 [Arachis hypogaea]